MKRTAKILAVLLTAMMILGAVPVFAADALPSSEKTDRFTVVDSDSNTGSEFSMISSDGQLVINISDGTPVTFEDGTPARDSLADGQTLADLMNTRLLVVTYTVTTKSMPPQTSPDSVVIMYEQAVTLPADVAPPVSPAPSTDFQGYFQLTDPTVSADSGFSMISQDGALVINIGDDTPITFDDGLPVRGNLADGQTLSDMLNNRNLDITYTVATASLPPQTTPDSIVVMYEKAVPLPETVVSPLDGSIAVLGDLIDAPAPYISDDGVIMVPLRAIAEKLGFDVVWDGTDQSVRLGKAVNLAIGKDYYTVGKMAPIQLGTAPELKDDRTYVPLSFFSTITAEYSAYCSFTGQIIIELADGAGSGVPDGAVN